MAPNSTKPLSLFLVASAVILTASIVAEAKTKKLTLYLQDIAFGPNATFFPVAGLPGKEWNYTNLGTLFVTDDPITVAASEHSPELGRAQGIYIVTDKKGRNLLVLLSLMFTSGPFNGSTIEIQGTSRQFDPARELSVVSGTGKFRFARGYSTSDIVLFDAARGYSVTEMNVTLQY